MQTRFKQQQALEGVLMSNKAFQFFPLQRPYTQRCCYLLLSGVVYKFECGLCNESYYDESIRHLNIRSEEHIGVLPLTGKRVKPPNNSAVFSFDKFSILAHENKKYLLKIKEFLVIMRDHH